MVNSYIVLKTRIRSRVSEYESCKTSIVTCCIARCDVSKIITLA